MAVESVRQYMTTPPLDRLPNFGSVKWSQDKAFVKSMEPDPDMDDFILGYLSQMSLEKTDSQNQARSEYKARYLAYLQFTQSDDPIAVKSREKFSVTVPVIEVSQAVQPLPESKPEGRGAGRRFASERDLERVLQESMRLDEERKEREHRLQKEKYRSEKEAMIPDMFWTEWDKDGASFYDTSGLIPSARLVAAWEVLPPVDNLTPEEAELFEKRYLEHPKQWGKVAEVIPNRDFGTCIQYYYLKKKELNLKEKLKKQPRRRKKGGRGKQRSSALVSELGNGENETEEQPETGENGERRRPRRAAAPTWGFEQPTTDSEAGAAGGTPRRGGGQGTKGEPGAEKVDGRKSRKRQPKDKEPKAPKANQTLAPTPATGAGRGGRSRSNSRAQTTEFQPPIPVPGPAPGLGPRDPNEGYERTQPTPIAPPFIPVVQPPSGAPVAPPVGMGQERMQPQVSTLSEVMAPPSLAPSLRPEPPPLPPPPAVMSFESGPPQATERRPPQQASSYWSVSEANEFPAFLKSFGTDWTAIATHMGSKTAIMVSH